MYRLSLSSRIRRQANKEIARSYATSHFHQTTFSGYVKLNKLTAFAGLIHLNIGVTVAEELKASFQFLTSRVRMSRAIYSNTFSKFGLAGVRQLVAIVEREYKPLTFNKVDREC